MGDDLESEPANHHDGGALPGILASRLHETLQHDPEDAWPLVLDFVRRFPDSNDAQHLVEDLVYDHGEVFIDRLERLAFRDSDWRHLVAAAYVGGVATVGSERFNALQDRLNAEDPEP
jgi:hypothetical protein